MPNFVQMSSVHCVSGERLIQFATEHLVTEVLIHPQVHFLKLTFKSNQFYLLTIAGEHFAAMYEEHAGKLHKASSHSARWIHLRRPRVLDTAGRKLKNKLKLKKSEIMTRWQTVMSSSNPATATAP